jgi:hypothetical protein
MLREFGMYKPPFKKCSHEDIVLTLTRVSAIKLNVL